jgi:hypothetical protein
MHQTIVVRWHQLWKLCVHDSGHFEAIKAFEKVQGFMQSLC